MERVVQIAYAHLLHAEKNPSQLQVIADRLQITTTAALALAIADDICDEFNLTER